MVGHVIAARENYNRVAFEAEGQYGYLDIIGFASLSVGDVIEGDLACCNRTFISINGERAIEVNIDLYGISRVKAEKEYERVTR